MKWVVFVSLIASALAQTTLVEQCTEISPFAPLPLNVYINGCETQPCLLPQLEEAVVNVVFKAPYTLRSMTTTATAFVAAGPFTLTVPYPLGANAVTCNFITNSYCPLLKDEVVSYRLVMLIESFMFVNTAATIEFVIRDDNNDPIYCIRSAIRIVAPLGRSTNTSTSEAKISNHTQIIGH